MLCVCVCRQTHTIVEPQIHELFLKIIVFFLYHHYYQYCVSLCVQHLCGHCRGQRTSLRSQPSPFTFPWAPEIRLQISGLHSKHFASESSTGTGGRKSNRAFPWLILDSLSHSPGTLRPDRGPGQWPETPGSLPSTFIAGIYTVWLLHPGLRSARDGTQSLDIYIRYSPHWMWPSVIASCT